MLVISAFMWNLEIKKHETCGCISIPSPKMVLLLKKPQKQTKKNSYRF